MKFVLKVAAAIVLAVCILNGLAAAGHAAATDEARLGWFEPIARAAWPASPCAGHEVIHLRADLRLAAEAPKFGATANQLEGLAEPDTCEIWMKSGLEAESFCTVLTHELGHLSGRGHTTIPGDVMNGEGDIYWAPCHQAVMTAQARGRSRAGTLHRSSRPQLVSLRAQPRT